MDIDELMYDNDDFLDNQQIQNDDDDSQQQDQQQQEDNNGGDEEDVLETFLKSQGIQDIHKIKFEDEDGIEQERDWNDLTREELLNILGSGQTPPEVGLDDAEIELINRIRMSRMSPQQYIESLMPQQVQDEPQYTVDNLSDDELYLLDLQTRIEDITEEQLQNALTKAKEDEDLFKKQIAGIRNEYKLLEDNKRAEQEAYNLSQQEQQYQQFSQDIVNSIVNLQNVGELDITMDDEDKDRLASFILDRDETGTSYFARALNNPQELVRMAWFALNGEDVLNSISNYYKKQISQVSKTSYQKGLEEGQKGKVAIRTNNPSQRQQYNVKSIENIIY